MAEKKEVAVAKEKTKLERIEAIKKSFEKDFGKGTLMSGSEKPQSMRFISTGSLGLDKALGIGGLPRGRVIEIYGPESSGKTTLCLEVIAQAHKDKDSQCAFIDMEHALDTKYAASLGVDIDRLQIAQPDYGEQALEIADRLVQSGDFDVVVIDSVAALVPKSELDGEMGDNKMGLHSRLMSQAMRKMTGSISKTGTICIFINQMRDKIGVMFGSPETTTGGNALKFYASVRMDIRRKASDKEAIKDGDVRIGNPVTVRVIKNKVSPPFTAASFDVIYGEGIDRYGEILDLAVDCDIMTKSGSWFVYKDSKIGNGREAAKLVLRDNDELFQEIREATIDSYTPKVDEKLAKAFNEAEKVVENKEVKELVNAE